MDIYVLDGNLEHIGLIDSYRSLIWTTRYWDKGDCELYVAASPENMALLQIGYYLQRLDDEMICRIVKWELQTDVENGDYLVVTGEDAKGLIDQRILQGTVVTQLTAEYFLRYIVNSTCVNAGTARNLLKSNGSPLMVTEENALLTKYLKMSTSYDNVGELTRVICRQFGYGYQVRLDEENKILKYRIYNGSDRSSYLVFTSQYNNIATTDYINDATNRGNYVTVAGEGEGSARTVVNMGTSVNNDRYELFVDARDVSRTISGAELVLQYSGSVQQDAQGYYYETNRLDIPIYTDDQLSKLETDYPQGTVITKGEERYYRLEHIETARLEKSTVSYSDNVDVNDLIYLPMLYQRGMEEMQEYGRTKTFTGAVEPNVTWQYKRDYFCGDIVTVENDFGISEDVRIVDVIEVDDESGYRVEPTFENITKGE